MVDHVGREDHRHALVRQRADHQFQLALVDRIEAREGLVEHHQPRLVHQRAEQLDGLRHALGQLADLAVGGIAEAVAFEQLDRALAPFLERQAPERTHEGDRLDAFHRGVEPALLGQVADQPADIVRAVVSEHAAHAFVRVDDAEQHPQRRGFPCAVGAENAVDRTLGDGNVHPVHRARAVKALDQPAGLDRQRARIGGNGAEAITAIARQALFAYRHVHGLSG